MYTNGVVQRTEEIEESRERDYFISELQIRKDQRQFVVRYTCERNPLIMFYRGFDEKSNGEYKLNLNHKIEQFQNIMYNEDNQMAQIKIIKVTAHRKGGPKFTKA
jgi:hypothetical protein